MPKGRLFKEFDFSEAPTNQQFADSLRLAIAAQEQSGDHWARVRSRLNHLAGWTEPFVYPKRYKAVYGGRGGGKSQFFAELLVTRLIENPDLKAVCIREIQASLRYSVKALIEEKINQLNVSHLFDIQRSVILRKGGRGLIIFQGMQDHTAESIKSLQGFDVAWVEEAQALSGRSLKLLRPTIRNEGSEIWFSWNPDQPEDAVDEFFRGNTPPRDAVIASVNWSNNPFFPDVLRREMEADRDRGDDYRDYYLHVWEGQYNKVSKELVYGGRWSVQEFEIDQSFDGPYYGADWGFGVDPTAAIELFIKGRTIYVRRDSYAYSLELDDTASRWIRDIPDIAFHTVRADNSRPESISHVRRGRRNAATDWEVPPIPYLTAVEKWPGSIVDGITFIQGYQIVVHPDANNTPKELKLYRYKKNKAGDITNEIIDKDNHLMDAMRYALAPLIKGALADKGDRPPVAAKTLDHARSVVRRR